MSGVDSLCTKGSIWHASRTAVKWTNPVHERMSHRREVARGHGVLLSALAPSGQPIDPDLALLNRRLFHRIPLHQGVSNRRRKGSRRCKPTICAMLVLNSLSPEMLTDCTRNLSRHRVSSGGSCFMAWSRTAHGPVSRQDSPYMCLFPSVDTAGRTGNLDIVTWLDATRVRSDAIPVCGCEPAFALDDTGS